MPEPARPTDDPAGAPAPRWPAGTARALLESSAVTAPTRAVLMARLDAPAAGPRFLDAPAFATLHAACARLVPVDSVPGLADGVAVAIDGRLADGRGDGWRYDALPPDGDAFRLGLNALDAAALDAHRVAFADLGPAAQDALLADAQQGRGPAFAGFDAVRWFEDWLAEAAGLAYSHPLAQEAIGYAGFADAGPGSPGGKPVAPGWTRIGLGEREAREPEALPPGRP